MSNSLANAVRSGGITQQEARLTWLLLGFTWFETQEDELRVWLLDYMRSHTYLALSA